MEPTVPLFRLPENVIVHVLQNMNFNELFVFSLVSTKSKNLVISLRLKASDVNMFISHEICVEVEMGENEEPIFVLKFYSDRNARNELQSIDKTLPVDAFLPAENETVQLSTPYNIIDWVNHIIESLESPSKKRIQSTTPFNFSNWLNHIRTVFCYTKPLNVHFFEECERFEVKSLKNTIGNVNYLSVSSEATDVYNKKVLKHFNTPNELSLDRNPFDEACDVQKFFIQNFELFDFEDVYSLDDILLINSEQVDLWHPISQKQFNQFIKHWIRGSNPRLQNMSVSIDITDSLSREMLLKGIKYVDVPEEDQLEICRKHRIDSDNLVKIKRKDGTPAVIAINEREAILNVHFIVLY
ncbi:hypothetical protein GCK72_008539 [Caenorhabditis remanei]|uniref:F-box domain-containing protein n=1 Tax=Caenorhabditis remanei TaxID=31234 RepID=A0A6A5H1F6_CAERE|nr:hypothetical protein GCK72_008539 [Caenorhabditis remanei]KAF1760292.1 hypothetical protein GCK72_008539 [Caenorhabditis remanei]